MKRLRMVCVVCGKEKSELSELEKVHEYLEQIEDAQCRYHPLTAEEKLLVAIFGSAPGAISWLE